MRSLLAVVALQLFCAEGFSFEFIAHQKLPQNSVSEMSIKHSNCNVDSIVTVETMQKQFQHISQTIDKRFRTIHGVQYVSQSHRAINIFYSLVGHKKIRQSMFDGCETVLCSLTRVFGEERTLKMIYILTNFGFNTSHLSDLTAQAWKIRDLDIIIQTFQNLPRFMYFQGKPSLLVRQKASEQAVEYKNHIGGIMLSGDIRMFNKWDELSERKKMAALTHEFAHYLGVRLSLQFGSDWAHFSQWYTAPSGEFKYRNYDNMISKYAKVDPGEDFAESFTAFRYNSGRLKSISPVKFKFLKNVLFGGLDYVSSELCQETEGAFVNVDVNNYVSLDKVFEQCSFIISKYNVGRVDIEPVENCLQGALSEELQLTISFKQALRPLKYKSLLLKNYNERKYPNLSKLVNRQSLFQAVLNFILQRK